MTVGLWIEGRTKLGRSGVVVAGPIEQVGPNAVQVYGAWVPRPCIVWTYVLLKRP